MPSTNYQNRLSYFPPQKVPSSKKTEQWYKDCIDSSEDMILAKDYWIRSNQYNKKVNYDLANDIIDERDIHSVFNPMGFTSGEIPAAINHYNISMNKINLLLGEEWRRPFDWRLIALNPDTHSERESIKKRMLFEIAIQEAQNPNFREEETQRRIKELDSYLKYEYQDLREITGTRILEYLWEEQRCKLIFNNGYKDALIAAEELYRTDIVGGNPKLTRCNPLHVFSIRNSDSNRLEDAELITEVSYEPIGAVLDEFADELTGAEIDYLEQGKSIKHPGILNHQMFSREFSVGEFFGTSELVEVNSNAIKLYGGYFNEHGEVRVFRARWRGMLKRYILTFFDEQGDSQEVMVSEHFKLTSEMKDRGWSVKPIWIGEWYEGVKIADKIYKKLGPRAIQFRNMSNPAICSSGYIGTYYNINSSRAISLMDRMKPWNYLYNVIMRRTELAIAQYKAPILRLNQALKPDEWEVDKWLYYATIGGILLIDPFNEGTGDLGGGKLAGQMNTMTSDFMNPQMGNYIQQHISLLQYIELMLGKISGVTEQREGQIQSRETVGGIERSVTQSSHITENWFILHEDTKKRALSALLETAKYAYRQDKNKSIPYILDDMSTRVLNIDGELFNESQYGLFVSDSAKDTQIANSLKEIAQASASSGGSMTQLIDILRSDSISSIARKIEKNEEDMKREAQEQAQQQMQAQAEADQAQRDFEVEEKDKDRNLEREQMQNDYLIAAMKQPGDSKTLDTMLKERDLAIKEMKQRMDYELAKEKQNDTVKIEEAKQRELERSNREDEALRRKELQVKKQSNSNKK